MHDTQNTGRRSRRRRPLVEHAATAENRELLVAEFASGSSAGQHVGVEMEHLLVRRGTGAPVTYSGDRGVEHVLERMSGSYETVSRADEDERLIIALDRPGHNVTLEPAAQLEISMSPKKRLADVDAEYRAFRAELDPALDEIGAETPYLGFHPTTPIDELELIPKYRYDCMNRYLGGISHYGPCMMRGTSSLQVSVDYADESEAIAKLRAASAIGPLVYLMLDDAPVFDGRWRTRGLVRAWCWEGCDPDRCGVVPGVFDEDFDFAAYADYVLATPAILVPDDTSGNGWRYTGGQPINDIYADRAMTQPELEHALTMFFPDVRLKTYVEIRQADAVPPALALAYVALIKGLFYDTGFVRDANRVAVRFDDDTIPQMKADIARDGYDAVLLAGTPEERTAAELADDLVARAAQALPDDERNTLDPLAQLVAQRVTPAMLWANPYELGPHGTHR